MAMSEAKNLTLAQAIYLIDERRKKTVSREEAIRLQQKVDPKRIEREKKIIEKRARYFMGDEAYEAMVRAQQQAESKA